MSALVMFFLLAVMVGNVTAVWVLNKLGLPAYIGNPLKDYKVQRRINKDCIGWVHIPDTCYSPILRNKQYKDKNVRGVKTKHGELHISSKVNEGDLEGVNRNKDLYFPDMTIVEGSATVSTDNIRETKFTYLDKYLKSDLRNLHSVITVIDGGKTRFFETLFSVELDLAEREAFGYETREDLLSSLERQATVRVSNKYSGEILILKGVTEVGMTLLFLIEKGDQHATNTEVKAKR